MNLLNAELVFYFVMFKVQICTGLSADPLVSGSALWIPQPLCSDLIRICHTEKMTQLFSKLTPHWPGRDGSGPTPVITLKPPLQQLRL